jgi:uncharacterized protein (TIGR02391 family)
MNPVASFVRTLYGQLRALACRILHWFRPRIMQVDNHVSTLYRELRAKAPTAPLTELLQSLVILAGDVQNREVEKWAKLELGGYVRDNPELNNDVVVPEYRTVAGIWHDRFGRPLIIDNPKLLFVNSYRLRNGVAELEELSQSDSPHMLLDPGLAKTFREELNVEVDRIIFGPREVVGVLSNIRTRFIDALSKLRDSVKSAGGDTNSPEEIKNTLELEGFHPLVIKHAGKLFEDGHHRQAILDTYIALTEQVKSLSGRYDLDGTGLMQTIFSPKAPKLSISTNFDEQMGFMWLFAGAVMGVRNPKAHAVTPHPDKQTTLEWLGFASVLFRVLDRATKNP